MIDYSLPTHRAAVWETFVICFSVSDRTLIIENYKEKAIQMKKWMKMKVEYWGLGVVYAYAVVFDAEEYTCEFPPLQPETHTLCFTNRLTDLLKGCRKHQKKLFLNLAKQYGLMIWLSR